MKATRLLLCAACALGLLLPAAAAGAAAAPVSSVMFLGNSYTFVNDLPAVFNALCKAGGAKVRVDSFTMGSCGLVDFYEVPKFNGGKKLLAKGKFDVIVMQDQSLVPTIRPDWTLKYTRAWGRLAAKVNTRPVYFMTWARCTPGTLEPDMYMQDKTTTIYCQAALRDNVTLVPCGEVWREWHRLYPAETLYESDGSHPNELGAYLNACTFYKVLCGKSPLGLPHKLTHGSATLVDITPAQARQCQELADKVTDSFNPQAFLDSHQDLTAPDSE